jgi:hypothetical protein
MRYQVRTKCYYSFWAGVATASAAAAVRLLLPPVFDFGMRPGPSPWPPGTNPGRTYRFYTGTPVLPFGFGLSYTTWTYTPFNPPAVLDLTAVRAAAAAQEATGVVGHIPAALQSAVVDYFVNVRREGKGGGGACLAARSCVRRDDMQPPPPARPSSLAGHEHGLRRL